MSVNLIDPDEFGIPDEKPHEKIEADDYHSLDEWENPE